MKYDSTSLKLPIENLEAEDYLPLNGTDYIEFYTYVNGTDDLAARTSATIYKLIE